MSRGAEIRLSHEALKANFAVVKQCISSKERASEKHIIPVIKANGYGHGAVIVAKTLLSAGAKAFAVAVLCEAQVLREAGITEPILILEGVFDREECERAVSLKCDLVVHSEYQLAFLEALKQEFVSDSMKVWLKVNTGMNRLGFSSVRVAEVYRRLKQLSIIDSVVLMTHMACADEPGHPSVQQQLSLFSQIENQCRGLARSVANSGLVLNFSERLTHPKDSSHEKPQEWLRPGIMLYGGSPSPDVSAAHYGLQPVMTLVARIIAIQELNPGESVGYGAQFVASENVRVAVVGIGYGDGYPRHAPTGTPVFVSGQTAQLVGRVSMDMITIDVTGIPSAEIGSEVELWGSHVSVDEVAKRAGTISYELFCRLTSRLPRCWE